MWPIYRKSTYSVAHLYMSPTPATLLPADEKARLSSLRHYDILHSLQEAIFDELVGLTARIFSLPISLIALVGADEVEYKASEGLPDLRQQPRVEALCSVAVRENKAVVFSDLSCDAQHRLTAQAMQAAEAKDLRFYAGVPLCMPDHRSIGTLCVIDHQPRTFSTEEQRVLEQLSGLVAQTIVVRHTCLITNAVGQRSWQRVQAQLVEEVRALVALVRYLTARFGALVPVSQAILDPIKRRLRELGMLLQEYPVAG